MTTITDPSDGHEVVLSDRTTGPMFTPGPWKALDRKDARGNRCGWCVWPDLKRQYADSPRGNQICATPDGTGPEREANARLIAACPELYEALLSLYTETADYIRVNDLGDIHHNRSMQLARAALAKATSR